MQSAPQFPLRELRRLALGACAGGMPSAPKARLSSQAAYAQPMANSFRTGLQLSHKRPAGLNQGAACANPVRPQTQTALLLASLPKAERLCYVIPSNAHAILWRGCCPRARQFSPNASLSACTALRSSASGTSSDTFVSDVVTSVTDTPRAAISENIREATPLCRCMPMPSTVTLT